MIAVVFALEFESAYFRARHDSRLRISTWLLGAMGADAALSLEKQLLASKPELVISAGFAGGLQPQLAVGDLVLGENYSDPAVVAKLELGSAWRRGKLETASAIVEKSADKLTFGQQTGAMIADLETAHEARICAAHGVPLLSIRCISDAVGDDMPVPAALLLNPVTGRPEPLQLFRHLITNPGSVPGFNQLLKNAKTAQKNLALGLEEVLGQLLRIS